MLSRIFDRIRPWTIVWIMVLWNLLQGDLTIANTVFGFLVGVVVVVSMPLPTLPIAGRTINWGRFFTFSLHWMKELFNASREVGWLGIRPQAQPASAIVTVPMRVSSEWVLTFATAAYNLQPGGTITDIDIANRMWTVHLLNASTPERLEREIAILTRLEKDMIDIFERGGTR